MIVGYGFGEGADRVLLVPRREGEATSEIRGVAFALDAAAARLAVVGEQGELELIDLP